MYETSAYLKREAAVIDEFCDLVKNKDKY